MPTSPGTDVRALWLRVLSTSAPLVPLRTSGVVRWLARRPGSYKVIKDEKQILVWMCMLLFIWTGRMSSHLSLFDRSLGLSRRLRGSRSRLSWPPFLSLCGRWFLDGWLIASWGKYALVYYVFIYFFFYRTRDPEFEGTQRAQCNAFH